MTKGKVWIIINGIMPAVITSQITNRLYNDYKDTELTFTKDIIHTLAMDPRQIAIKSEGSQWPCILNSTSFNIARIIVGTKGGAFQQLVKKDIPPVSVRFCFYKQDGQLMSFFISGKVQNIQPYMNSNDLAIVTIRFTQRPPDDLILMVGRLLDANVGSVRRKDEKIVITPESSRKLNLTKKEVNLTIDTIQRNCILHNLSFGGCGVIVMGIAQFLKGKTIKIKVEFEDPHEIISLDGTIVAANPIENRKELAIATIRFTEASVSLAYKLRINNYLSTVRKDDNGVQFEGEKPVVSVQAALQQAQSGQAAPDQAVQPAPQTAPAAQPAAEAPVQSALAETSTNPSPDASPKTE